MSVLSLRVGLTYHYQGQVQPLSYTQTKLSILESPFQKMQVVSVIATSHKTKGPSQAAKPGDVRSGKWEMRGGCRLEAGEEMHPRNSIGSIWKVLFTFRNPSKVLLVASCYHALWCVVTFGMIEPQSLGM